MGLATSTVKNVILLLNFILTILGLALIGFGIFIVVCGAENKVDHGEKTAGGLIIALGVAIVVVAIFGCLVAIHESRRKLVIYVLILVLLILIQLLMSSMASLGTQDGLSGSVRQGFEHLWQEEQRVPGALAFYEDWLHCCGVNNTEDYRRIQHDIPKTCCRDYNCARVDNIYGDGCQAKFEEYLAGKMLAFNVINWLLIIVEIVAAVFGWMMFSTLKNESRRNNLTWM